MDNYIVLPSRRYPEDSKWWDRLIELRRTPESREPRWGFVDKNEGVVAIGWWLKKGLDCATLTRAKGLKVKFMPAEGDLQSVTDESLLEAVMNRRLIVEEAGK